MGNAVIQWQMVSLDPKQSATFYGRLFGWTINQENALGYRVVQTQSGKGIDGGIWPAPPQERGFVQLFVEVPDVEACVATAVGLGATVVVPTSVLPDGDDGRAARSLRDDRRSLRASQHVLTALPRMALQTAAAMANREGWRTEA
jgi:predicted enzyme related to lactoylglutathione lyase